MPDITPNTEVFETADMVPAYKEGNTKQLLEKISGNAGYCKRKIETAHRLGDQTSLGTNPTPTQGERDPNNLGGFINFYWGGLVEGDINDDLKLVDDTFDWRDRGLFVCGYYSNLGAPFTDTIPGGAKDEQIDAYIEVNGTDNNLYFSSIGYTHAGVDTTGVNIQIRVGSSATRGFMVDVTTGYLYYLDNNVGNTSWLDVTIHYSQQFGHRDT